MAKINPKRAMEKILPKERASSTYRHMKNLFGEETDPMDVVDHQMYKRGGLQQSRTKSEFTEWGKRIALERGIPSYNREVGIPMGQRWLTSGTAPGTDTVITFDDVMFFNNSAEQQMIDDIKRTIIVNLDIPHRTIQLRLGKEISPETMNLYMETLQHRLAGGAVIQEHMAEAHPGMTKDGYGKVFTGDDELADQFDRRFVININSQFHPDRAEMMKVGVGDKLCCVIREPTIRVRSMDGGAIVRSAAQSATMAFVATYRLTGESVLSDIAFSTRHAQQIRMGENMWANRARSPNEIGGMAHGYITDTTAAEIDTPPIPMMIEMSSGDMDSLQEKLHAIMNAMQMYGQIIENIWLGQQMAGGIGFPSAGLGLLGGFEDLYDVKVFSSFGSMSGGGMPSMVKGHDRMPDKWTAVKPFVHMMAHSTMDLFDKYPTMMEFAWGGAHRMGMMGFIGAMTGFMTGDAVLGQLAGNYCIGLLAKEGWLRTGWAGQEVQHHIGPPYLTSLRFEEGGLPELKGMNVPYVSYTAVGGSMLLVSSYSAMLGRGSAWACSPLVKVAFSCPDLVFDFKEPIKCFAKAAIREFEPGGERDIIRPAR